MSRKRFCAECGDTESALHNNFCKSCYWKLNSLSSLKKPKIDLPYCLNCGSVKLNSGWTGSNTHEEIPEIIAYSCFNNIITKPTSIIMIDSISDIHWLNPNPEFIITYEIENSDIASFETHSEKLETEIKIHGGTCTTCVKKKTGSGEVTVQFRAKNRKLLQVEIDSATTVAFSLASSMNVESKDAYLSEIIENHGGLDFYFGNDLIAETFIQKLKNIWIGHYEKNFKLITEDADEKRVYSVTHLYRIPNIIPAELIEFENRLASVISVNKNGVLIKFLNTKTTKLTKKWDKLVAIDPSPELVKKLVVSENHKENSYLIMDMNNYQTEELAKDFFINKLETSQEYDFYKWKDNYYLPPK